MRVCGCFVVVEHYRGFSQSEKYCYFSMVYGHRKVRIVYSHFKDKEWEFFCDVRGLHHVERVKLWDPMRSIG